MIRLFVVAFSLVFSSASHCAIAKEKVDQTSQGHRQEQRQEESSPSPSLSVEEKSSQITQAAKEEDSDHFFQAFINMLTTLGIIIAFLLLASWALKRLFKTKLEQINATSQIKILERRQLTAKSAIYLLEVLGKKVAIVETASGAISLGEFSSTKEKEEENCTSKAEG